MIQSFSYLLFTLLPLLIKPLFSGNLYYIHINSHLFVSSVVPCKLLKMHSIYHNICDHLRLITGTINLKNKITRFNTSYKVQKKNVKSEILSPKPTTYICGGGEKGMGKVLATVLHFLSCFLTFAVILGWKTAVYCCLRPKVVQQSMSTSWKWRDEQEINLTKRYTRVAVSPGRHSNWCTFIES